MLVKICLCTIMLSAISGNLKNCSNKRITVTGIARESMAGAIVDTDNVHYFVDRLDDWDKKYYGKKVKVTGRLVIEKHEKRSTDSIQVQEIVGTVAILKRPKWSLVE
jgi:hypothetical protein